MLSHKKIYKSKKTQKDVNTRRFTITFSSVAHHGGCQLVFEPCASLYPTITFEKKTGLLFDSPHCFPSLDHLR